LTGQDKAKVLIESELNDLMPYYKEMKQLKEMEGVQARLPFMIEFN